MTRNEALRLRAIVEQAAASLDDQTASEGAALFPRLKGDGSLVSAGTRINWNGVIKRVAIDLWDTTENNPDNAPSLWVDIAYREGIRIIPAQFPAMQMVMPVGGFLALGCVIAGSQWLMKHLEMKSKKKEAAK